MHTRTCNALVRVLNALQKYYKNSIYENFLQKK